jgi:hypothetical protein
VTGSKHSKLDRLDRRFALVDDDGVARYPYRTHKQNGQFGFVLGRDRSGSGVVVWTIEEVVHGVVLEAMTVRASDDPPSQGKGANSVGLRSRGIRGYLLDETLRGLIVHATVQPMGQPGDRAANLRRIPVQGAAARAQGSPETDPLIELDALTVDQFINALECIEPQMTPSQKEMLRGHVNAPAKELTMQNIAGLGRHPDYRAANMQYGRLGRMFAQALGVDHEMLANKVQAMCQEVGRRDEAGHFVWSLRPQLARALALAGWEEPEIDGPEALAVAGAADELASEPGHAELAETTRRALINARVGQGGFRKRMLRLWGGRCAVTGLGVQEALTASHALAWQHSDNHQRLDEHNGLLLSATLDRLFDRGLISFSDGGDLLASPHLDAHELVIAGLSSSARLRLLPPRCLPYLAEHRKRFGFEAGER